MITIKVKVDQTNSNIINYSSKGHAGSNMIDINKDHVAVCNSLSTLEYQFFYSVRLLCSTIKNTHKIGNGFFAMCFTINNQQQDKHMSVFTTLSQAFLIGVKMLKKKYTQIISLTLES